LNWKRAWKVELIEKITHFGRIYTKPYLPVIPDQVRNDGRRGVVVISVDERERSKGYIIAVQEKLILDNSEIR
jgi:hypothetical protein